MNAKDYSCDLLVVGGGLTGVAAAVAARRKGVKDVMLIERYGFLGGMATAGLVNPFMTYFKSGSSRDKENQLVFGIFQEILHMLDELGGLRDKTTFDAEAMKLTLSRIAMEAGVKLLLHTRLTGVVMTDNSTIEGINIISKSGNHFVKAKVFIDCTGDADLASMSGVPCKKGRDEDGSMQPMTMCFRVANVDRAKMPPKGEIDELYREAVSRGEIHNPREDVLFFDTMQPDVIHFNTTRIIQKDGTNAEELTQAELEAREQCWEMFWFLKKYVAGFENAYFQMTAPQIGVRETRRIEGQYTLTADDVLEGRVFDDSICYCAYVIDIHNPLGSGTVIRHLRKGSFYGIPYRCLLPKGIDNLLVAGRPISATHEAHSSLRIMPTCAGLGQAAGTAAALSIKDSVSPSSVDGSVLRDVLVEDGALPRV